MFRPSRPMIRPFMSSVGMSTVLTVVSAVCAGGVALDGGGEDLAGLLLAGLLEHLLVLEDQAADLVAAARPRAGGGAGRGPPRGRAGRGRWSDLALVGEGLLDLGVPAVELLLLLGEVALDGLELALLLVDQVELLVEQVVALLQPPLLLAEAPCGRPRPRRRWPRGGGGPPPWPGGRPPCGWSRPRGGRRRGSPRRGPGRSRPGAGGRAAGRRRRRRPRRSAR